MKTSALIDYSHQINTARAAAYAEMARRRRTHQLIRICAWFTATTWVVLIGISLGALAAHAPSRDWAWLAIICLSAAGAWGLNHLLTRH